MTAPALPSFAAIAGTALTLLAALYALAALLCRGRPAHSENVRAATPVTVLKPLCGAEPRLEDNLAGLCTQTHPCYQLVFGVRAPDDPAIAVVERLARRFPRVDMRLVVDPRVHGRNRKVSNLINMMHAARHPWLVLADSDIAVEPDYLARVTAPLAAPDVGIVTCLYHGRPLSEQSVWTTADMPPMITLYRAPLLREWRETGVELDDLVTHVVVHEVGHHFGLSDEDMHRIEDESP